MRNPSPAHNRCPINMSIPFLCGHLTRLSVALATVLNISLADGWQCLGIVFGSWDYSLGFCRGPGS